MHYALLIGAHGASADEHPADDGVFDNWIAYTQAVKNAGVLLGAQQPEVVDTATTVRLRGGERLLTDGPSSRPRSTCLGSSSSTWPTWTRPSTGPRRCPICGTGTTEVRPVKQGMAWQIVLQ